MDKIASTQSPKSTHSTAGMEPKTDGVATGSSAMPPPAPRAPEVRPMAPTRPPPRYPSPPRPGPRPVSAPAEANPPDPPQDLCSCLLKLRDFCPGMRELAGTGGITPSLLFSRTKKEVQKGITASSRGWNVKKIWRVKEGPLSRVRSHNILASGGLPSISDKVSKSLHQSQGDKVCQEAPSYSIVQVDNIVTKKAQCDVSYAMQMDVTSNELVQVDYCYIKSTNSVQNVAQVDMCYDDARSGVSDIVQVDNIVNKSPSSSDGLVQVDNSFKTLNCDIVQVENDSYKSIGSSLVQVDKSINVQPSVCDVVQVENMYNTLNCDVVQVENVFNTLSCDVVQVDNIVKNSASISGSRVVQVEDLNSKATANGSNLVQVDKLLNSAPAQGGSVVQVEKVIYSDIPFRDGDVVVQVGDIYIPTNPQREGLHKVICSRGVKRKRS